MVARDEGAILSSWQDDVGQRGVRNDQNHCCCSGSDYGIAAARTAVQLVAACQLESLTFVHVVSLKPGQIGTLDYPERPDIPERWPVFQEPLGIARSDKVRARCEVLYGHPAEQILHYARQQKVDLIIMGSLGISGIKEFFLGSVASRVVADAPCSVWVVRPGFRLGQES